MSLQPPGDPYRVAVDLVEIDRFRRFHARAERAQLESVFTLAELEYAGRKRDSVSSLAARFAVKEAVIKLLGELDLYSVKLTDIEIVAQPSSRPQLALSGVAAGLAADLGFAHVSISLSHTRRFAIGEAMALSSVSSATRAEVVA